MENGEWVGVVQARPFSILHSPFSMFHVPCSIFQSTTHISAMDRVARHVPARTNDGWPVVGLVVLLAAACIVSVTVIHNRTYKHPSDPTWHSVTDPKAEH
jgi:hypothetical protein